MLNRHHIKLWLKCFRAVVSLTRSLGAGFREVQSTTMQVCKHPSKQSFLKPAYLLQKYVF